MQRGTIAALLLERKQKARKSPEIRAFLATITFGVS